MKLKSNGFGGTKLFEPKPGENTVVEQVKGGHGKENMKSDMLLTAVRRQK